MKHKKKTLAALTLLLCLALTLSLARPSLALAEEKAPVPIRMEIKEARGAEDDLVQSYVKYPVFSSDDETLAPALEKASQLFQEKARIPEYLQLLSTLIGDGTGLRMDCRTTAFVISGEDGPQLYDWYVSILFSAEGKMLSGRPSQVYYPMTINLSTGEEVPFDALFSDPEGARAYIENTLEEEIEPALSTYLENNQLFPVPFDRYWIDNASHIEIYYENSQLSFLSGYSGAVSFRFSELDPWLDKTENGLISHFAYGALLNGQTDSVTPDTYWHWLKNGALLPGAVAVSIGETVEDVEKKPLHFTADSGFYPGGAYLEAEEAAFRGALILTDESEEKVTGLLSGRIDLFGIITGKTSLADAEKYLGREPDARVGMDETAAELYCVCPGTAAVYRLESYSGQALRFTLYADTEGAVQYLKLALE